MTRAAVEKGETMEYEIKPLTPEEAEYIGGKLEEYVRSVPGQLYFAGHTL